ncbi:MAG: glycosyltransferase family 2 protein, partial [Fervidobacterium sp.]
MQKQDKLDTSYASNKPDPKVSVIIISKNEEHHIEDCLKSIFKQTYRNIEIIVVDSSTDRTPEIIKRLSKESPFPMKIVLQEAKGCGFARNTGLMMASGDVVTFIDADELIPPDYMEKVVNEFEDPKCLGVRTRVTLAKPSNQIGKVFWLYERIFHP